MVLQLPIPEPPIQGQKKMMKRRTKPKNKKSSKGGIFGGIAANPSSGLEFNFGKPATQANLLSELIEGQAARLKHEADAKAAAQLTAQNPYDLMQQQLYDAVNNTQVQTTPIEELRKIATDQVSAQYDPQLAALGQQIISHKKRGESSQKEARQMYGDMSSDFLAQLPQMTSQFAAEDKETNNRYDAAQAQMNDEYQRQSAQQAAVLKKLGISAAAPDASQQAMEDQAYFQNQSELSQQQAMDALNLQQGSQQQYQRDLGNNARMAGENTAQDIGQQLNDYLTQADSQMTSLVGSKESAIAALLGQMQQQDAQNAQQQSQQQFQNQLALMNFQLTAQQARDKAESTASGEFGSKGVLSTGLPGAQNFLATQYPDQPILAQNLMKQINNVLSDPTVAKGKYILEPDDPNTLANDPKYSDVGQQYMERLLRKNIAAQGGRYGTGDINAAIAALEAYLGKVR